MMKTAILALTTLAIASGSALAAQRHDGRYDGRGNVSPYERMAIAKAGAKLATVKRQALRDGKISFFERVQIKNAERQYYAALARAKRT